MMIGKCDVEHPFNKLNEVENWLDVAVKRKHTHIKIVMGIEPYTGIKVKYGWKWVAIE